MELKEFSKFSKLLALESGKIIRNYFRKNIIVENKRDSSPVTIADKKAEELLRELILKEYPDHGIIGEEFGKHNENAEYQWILDPIDGTKSFIYGAITFGTLIALTKNSKPILGVFYQPVLNEFLIGDNATTSLNEEKVKVQNINKISDAVLLTTDHIGIGQYQNMENFNQLIKQVKLYRLWGDCYGYYLVASGFAHIMIDPIMNFWDIMALIPIIKGAGGVITDYQGGNPIIGNSIVASVPNIHEEVIKILNL